MIKKILAAILIMIFLQGIALSEEKKSILREIIEKEFNKRTLQKSKWKKIAEDIEKQNNDTLPVHLEIISWVEVHIRGNLLKQQKNYLEKLVRLRLRNDLSMIDHEYVRPGKLLEKYAYDFHGEDLKKRAMVHCTIGTFREVYPIAIFGECEMIGLGKYEDEIYRRYKGAYLGITLENSVKQSAEESMRTAITAISMEILESRDHLR